MMTKIRKLANILKDFKILQFLKCVTVNRLIEDIQKHIDPFQTEKHIKMFARILVRKGIIDSDRIQTFYIIFSFGFSQNYIVVNYMIPAQVEYLLLKILKENGESIEKFNKEGTIKEYIQLNDVLNDDKHSQNIKKYIDNDIFDQFKYLFKHDNMRNNIYHGQCGDDLKDSGYLWHLFCRLVLTQYIKRVS